MSSIREVSEGQQEQGVDESIVWTITTTNAWSSPSSPSMKVYDETNGDADVTSTVSSGSPTVSGDVITLPTIDSLTLDHYYRVEVAFTSGSSTPEHFFRLKAT